MSRASDERDQTLASEEAVRGYKRVLQRVVDTRPSGTRQRLAAVLGKNRSFITQITNPAYATPIPARHVETIMEVCHFSPDDRAEFLNLYARAHPRRPAERTERRVRPHTIYLPDLGDDERNHELDRTVGEFVQRLTSLIEGE
jgi:hypothetical protein